MSAGGTRDAMRTISGVYFDLLEPKLADIRWRDIAHSLAMLPRYAGHTPWAYPVAQHSILAARLALADKQSPSNVMAILLHDAGEAYVGDIISPVKRWATILSEREEIVLDYIFQKAGLQEPHIYDEVIEHYDGQLFVDEVNYFFPLTREDPRWHLPAHSVRNRHFRRYKHGGLKAAFLRELESLGARIEPAGADTRAAMLGITSSTAYANYINAYIKGGVEALAEGGRVDADGEEYVLIRYTETESRNRVLGVLEEIAHDLGGEPYSIRVKRA